MIRKQPLEKLFRHDLHNRIMIRPHGAVLPIGMGIVEILAELSKAICLLRKNGYLQNYGVLFGSYKELVVWNIQYI